MNNEGGSLGGQQGSQQQSMQQRSYNALIRPEQIQILPHLDQQQKQKLEQNVKSLYSRMAARPPDSEEHKLAYKKLLEWTHKLRQDVNAWKMRMAAQQAGSQPRIGPDQQQQPQRPQSQSGHSGTVQQQPQPHQQAINAAVMQHVQSFEFVLPPGVNPESPDGEKALANLRNSYLSWLTKQEQAAATLKHLKVAMEQRKAQGLEIPSEAMARKSQAEASYNQMKIYVDDFRRKQVAWGRERNERQQQQNGGNIDNGIKSEGSMQPGNEQQHNQQQPQNHQAQGQQQIAGQSQSLNTDAGENTRTQSNVKQNLVGTNATSTDQHGQQQQQQTQQQRLPPQQQQQHQGQQQERPNSAQQGQSQAQRVQQMPSQGNTFPAVDMAQNAASIQIPPQQQRHQPSYPQQRTFAPGEQPQYSNGQLQSPKNAPTSAISLTGHPSNVQPQQQQPLSATSGVGPLGNNNGTNGASAGGGPPVVLTQSAALSAAARQYNDSRGGVNASSGSGGYLQLGNREQNTNPKMPITKTLNVSAPQPVAMGPARPTMAGPTNGGPIGVMGQPAIPKAPGYVLEGDGDRVLSKKKLDELVRQVTGSGSGGAEAGIGEGEGLTPEVEDVSGYLFLFHFSHLTTCLITSCNHLSPLSFLWLAVFLYISFPQFRLLLTCIFKNYLRLHHLFYDFSYQLKQSVIFYVNSAFV